MSEDQFTFAQYGYDLGGIAVTCSLCQSFDILGYEVRGDQIVTYMTEHRCE